MSTNLNHQMLSASRLSRFKHQKARRFRA